MKKTRFFLSVLTVTATSITVVIISCLGQEKKGIFKHLDQSLRKEYDGKFGFSVLIGDEKGIPFSKEYGYTDSVKTKKIDQGTLYQIASINKSITAIGIFQLIEKNKLRLNDAIGKFFDDVPRDKRFITVGNLLTHKSGFNQNYACYGIGNSHEALKALLEDTLGSAPGTNFNYSNENFELLALIIEKVTGISYEKYIRDNILLPLNMKDTYFWNEVKAMKNIASKNQDIPDSILGRNWDYIGSGGIYSTTSDLYRFIRAVINNQIISQSSSQILFTEQHKTISGLSICYGWFKNDSTEWNIKEIWTRGSESWGHNAVIRWFPDKKKIIIVCTNSGEIGDKRSTGNRIISDHIANILFAKMK